MTWILTHSGRKFDYADPQPDQIDIIDIAYGLANESRFAGQTGHHYSVAQHSVMTSYLVSHAYRLEALLHDAGEAYMKDIPTPLKRLLPDYQDIANQVDQAIRLRFGLPLTESKTVKTADLIMLATEKRDLMPFDSTPWPMLRGVEPQPRGIYAASPAKALGMFCRRWMEIQGTMIGA